MKREILDQWGDLSFCLSYEADEAVIDLLANTLYGTPGATIYQHLNVRERLGQIREARFLTLKKGGNLIAVLVLCRRMIALSTGEVPSYYIRYFSMHPSFQRKGKPKGTKKRKPRLNLVQRTMHELLSHPERLEGGGKESVKAVFYAYVELENERSMMQTQLMGFEKISDFSTVALSRFSPRADKRVRRLRAEEQESIKEVLAQVHVRHAFYFQGNLFRAGNFYVMEEKGEIVGGVLVHPVEFKVHHLPGLSGKVMIRILPLIPGVSRIFNPKAYRFLATDSCFVRKGREDCLQALLESALYHEKRNGALIWSDRSDPLLSKLRKHVRLGLLNKFRDEVPVDVIYRCVGLSEAEKAELRNRPVYLSALDMT